MERKNENLNCNNEILFPLKEIYEELFKIDPRDVRVAINISDVYLDNSDYRQAIKWADKATDIDPRSADALGQKGKVYYYG